MELGSSLASAAQVFDCEVQVRPQQVAGFVDGLVLSLLSFWNIRCALKDHISSPEPAGGKLC